MVGRGPTIAGEPKPMGAAVGLGCGTGGRKPLTALGCWAGGVGSRGAAAGATATGTAAATVASGEVPGAETRVVPGGSGLIALRKGLSGRTVRRRACRWKAVSITGGLSSGAVAAGATAAVGWGGGGGGYVGTTAPVAVVAVRGETSVGGGGGRTRAEVGAGGRVAGAVGKVGAGAAAAAAGAGAGVESCFCRANSGIATTSALLPYIAMSGHSRLTYRSMFTGHFSQACPSQQKELEH